MYLMGERPEYAEQLFVRIRKITAHMLAEAPEPEEVLQLAEVPDLFQQFGHESLYVIEEGALQGVFNQRSVVVYEPGDIIGLTNFYDLPSLKLTSDEHLTLKRYDGKTLLRYLKGSDERQNMLISYLITQISLFKDAYSRMVRAQSRPNTGFLHFHPGDVIIHEGDDAHEVYTIMQGKADVFVDGTKVGEVLRDEIFGAMAVFTGSKRSATVIASENCSVLAVPRDEFVTLMQTHPETTMTLIENMARRIMALNAQLAESRSDDELVP